jgi:hypothetical protein
MKKIILLFLLTISFSGNLFSQKNSSYELANYYLKEKGEVVIHFKANTKQEFHQIGRLVSLGHNHVEESELEGEAYVNTIKQFQDFLKMGVYYEVTKENNEIPQEYTMRALDNTSQAINAWDTTWDSYPRYSEYVAKMQYWATTYPTLCKLEVIGTTPLGRTLYVLKISDNPLVDETEPEFFYTSSMHGDEITGYPTMLHLIDYLLTNYSSLSEVSNIINGTEIYINPLANPDGSYKTAANDIYNPGGATNTPTRANSAGSDLNRNYPDAIGGLHDDGLVYQPETVAFMNFTASRNFVLAANYHGGTEVINYPLDTSTTPGTGAFSYHPHDLYLKYISEEYAGLCQVADGNLDYMDAVYNSGQMPGVTNGAAWYSVYGGRQDASNYFDHNKEITVEISNAKTPAASTLPFFWDRNRQALLNYMKQANYGLHGIVTDQSGNPIHAKVYVAGTADNFGAWVETSPTKGDYHKVQIAGTYSVIFEAPGYASQTHTVTLTNGATTTLNITMVPSTSIPVASDVTICQGQTTNLSATGTGTIRWYDTVNATTELVATPNYLTPALTTTRSYWVERDVALANVGPAVSGTGVNNTTLRNRYLIFNCTTPTKLKSVSISNSAVGDIMVELQNSSGVMLESKVVRLTTTGVKDITLDFFLPAATGLRLVSRQLSTSTNLLTRANSGITYPITSGNISITGNSGTGTFFQFFTWKLAPIKSNRDEVIVTVKPNPTNTSISPTTRTAGSGAFTLTVTGTNFENGDIVRWNGVNRTTTFVSAIQLTAAIAGPDVATAGNANVTVYRTCNTSTSSAQTLTINGGCVATAPVPNVGSLPNVTGQCNATVVNFPTATSNCYGQIIATTPSPLTYNTQGTFNIVWTYNDGNGNTSTQNQTVIVTNGGPIITYYQDIDDDGFGDANVTISGCVQPNGYVTNNTDCNDAFYSLTNTCISVVNLKVFIEGYYVGGSGMRPVQSNQGIGNSATDTDLITVQLRNSTTHTLEASIITTLQTDGNAVCTFPSGPNGSYYLTVKGTNFIETWSANPINVGPTTTTYDFSTAANKAFGNNMAELEPGVFGCFSGDLNQDELIDSSDYSLWETDANNFEFGNFNTDLNGDGNVDSSDYSLWESNSNNFITVLKP